MTTFHVTSKIYACVSIMKRRYITHSVLISFYYNVIFIHALGS